MIDSKPLSGSLLSLVLLLAGCSHTQVVPGSGGGPRTSQITGSVAYRERIALPPTAVVTVRRVDVSRADAPGRVDIELRRI